MTRDTVGDALPRERVGGMTREQQMIRAGGSVRAATAAIQRGAAMCLRKGDKTHSGWSVVAVVPSFPWPWVLLERGNALGRSSPHAVLKDRAS